ncbi:hypothetical protein C8Q77DRAFT_1091841 [Trametes polyzona]|nr:hypothetical protein C8Q77DRAFT_1091841 [Trametes polyzona]
MSDAFSDLWNSTGVSKPAEPPRKLGALASAAPAPNAPRKPQNDVFSMLAAAGSSSTVGSRSGTPAQSPALGSNVAAKPMQKAASTGTALNGGDAFSNLLSGFSTQSANTTNLTMAQRAALAEKERRERAQQQQQQTTGPASASSAWAGLDALGATTASTRAPSASHDPLDDLGFGAFTSSSSSASAPKAAPLKAIQSAPPPEDDWGFGEFSSQPAGASGQKNAAASQFDDLLGIDDFAPPSAPRQSSSPAPPRSDTPGDFDFGDREDGLLGNHSADEDDILGDLGKPVEQLTARQSARNTPSPQPPQSGQRSRAVSPPPHILGQIVEMGFSLQQARVALAATDTGLDVQAALDMLLSNGAASSSPGPERQEDSRRRPQREPGHERYYGSDEEETPVRRPQRTATRPSPQAQRPARERAARDGGPSSDTQKNIQEQADKLLAQASEVGLNLFNRANAFWKEGKERVQRAYEERAAASGAGPSRQSPGDNARKNGRPKWMQDASEDEHASEPPRRGGGFKDDDDDVPPPPRRAQAQQQKSPPRGQEQAPSESPASRLKVGNLFSDDPPSVYVSPFRRKGPSRGQAESPAASSPAAPSQRPSPSPAAAVSARAPSPVPVVQRQTVSASPAAIAESAKHKAAGTEKFKLGQYAEAESLYSAAISALPASHLLLVPLLNNRALTRLKTGDHPGAIEDCTAVISLIGPGYHPAREARVVREEDGAGVDLADGLVKAWRRRAEAYEGREKWDAAKQDWEAIAGADFAGKARSEAVRGIGRCRRMLNTDAETGTAAASSATRPQTTTSKPKPAPAPKPKPKARVPTPPSEALNRVREANEAAEAEDQARHELKDSVEARLAAWKAGKETNLRALIASLDTVLWPELGWQKVGIHELVSPSQVKIRYTKAIAKVHPDKLNVRNTTVEQRMIANGVFGALNEAWNAFKP